MLGESTIKSMDNQTNQKPLAINCCFGKLGLLWTKNCLANQMQYVTRILSILNIIKILWQCSCKKSSPLGLHCCSSDEIKKTVKFIDSTDFVYFCTCNK